MDVRVLNPEWIMTSLAKGLCDLGVSAVRLKVFIIIGGRRAVSLFIYSFAILLQLTANLRG